MPTLAPAPRILRRRSRGDWLVLSATAVVVLIAMVQLSAGPIYSDAVTLGALRKTLEDAPNADRAVRIELRTTPEGYADADEAVIRAVEQTFPDGASVTRDIESITYALPDQPSEDRTDLVVLRHLEGIEDHATLIAGVWPGPDGDSSPVAVESRVAGALGLGVGDELELVSRRAGTSVRIEIVGLYGIDDPDDGFWSDELLLDGVVDSNSFRTFGPFVVTRDAMLGGLTTRTVSVWWVEPDLDQLTVDASDRVRVQVQGLPSLLDAELIAAAAPEQLDSYSDFGVVTGLDSLLAGAERSLTVTRSGVLAVIAQLTLLAVYALVLTAGLMVETRRTEGDLMGARGASPGQLLKISTTEAIAIAVPAALIAPWLASRLVSAIGSLGPLGTIDLDLDPRTTGLAAASLGVAVVVVVGLLSWPALRSARRGVSSGTRHRRLPLRAATQRTGVDIALVLLCGLAFWQLSELGPDQAATIQGRFSVDPLLVVTPAIGLLAGAVLALRVIPLLAVTAERMVTANRSLVPALAGWQVARRPTRHARSALLLIMAVTLGFFAAAYTASWDQSQDDQAAYQVGADLRSTPNRRTGDSMTDLHLTSAHESIDGVSASMPVVRRRGPLVGSDVPAEFVILDASRADETVRIRDDLASDFDELMSSLAAERPILAGIELPGEPSIIRLEATATETEIETEDGEVFPVALDGRVRLVVRDADDLLHRLELGTLTANEGARPLEVVVAEGAAVPAYPLSLIGLEVLVLAPQPPRRTAMLEIGELSVESAAGDTTVVAIDHTTSAWTLRTSSGGNLTTGPVMEPAPTQSDGSLRLAIDPGTAASPSPIRFGLSPTGTVYPDSIPVVVTRDWLDSTRTAVGDEVPLPSLQTDRDFGRIVGAVESFPTVDPSLGQAILVDLPTFQAMDLALDRGIVEVGEHWLAVEGDPATVSESLLDAPIETVVVIGRDERASDLKTDPTALGSIGALTIGFVAAGVFAAVGFVVSSIVSIRERAGEFALLRALGLTSRQIARGLATEQLALIIVSLVLGTILGVTLSATIIPLISVTQDGSAVLPALRVVYPWRVAVLLDLVLVVALAVVVFVTAVVLPRRELGARLRTGDE